MAIQRIPELVPPLKVSEMEIGGGWIARRMIGEETDIDIIRMKVLSARDRLAQLEVLTAQGFECVRPS